MSYEDLYEMFGPGEGRMKGASEACISELPWFMVSETNSMDMHGEKVSCTICLQVSYIASQLMTVYLTGFFFCFECV